MMLYIRSILALAITMCPQLAVSGSVDVLSPFPKIEYYDWRGPTPVAVIDEDDRKSEAEYARENGMSIIEVRHNFSATGEIVCSNSIATAQLTLAKNIITTAAHVFFDEDTCRLKSAANGCVVRFDKSGRTQIYRVSELISTGYKCPTKPGFFDDWAVLKLERT